MTIPPKSSLPPIFAEACKHRMRRVRIKTGGRKGLQMRAHAIPRLVYQLSGYQFSLQKKAFRQHVQKMMGRGGFGQ